MEKSHLAKPFDKRVSIHYQNDTFTVRERSWFKEWHHSWQKWISFWEWLAKSSFPKMKASFLVPRDFFKKNAPLLFWNKLIAFLRSFFISCWIKSPPNWFWFWWKIHGGLLKSLIFTVLLVVFEENHFPQERGHSQNDNDSCPKWSHFQKEDSF